LLLRIADSRLQVKMAFEGTERVTVEYIDSKNGKVLDSFVLEH